MLVYQFRGDTLTVRLTGELDHHSAAGVREEIDRLIERHKNIRHLVFDMAELAFMDSSGIGVIIGRYKRMAEKGGQVRILRPGQHVDRIFAMSGLYQIVEKIS